MSSPISPLSVAINRENYFGTPPSGVLPLARRGWRPNRESDDTEALDALQQPIQNYIVPSIVGGLIGYGQAGIPGAVAGAAAPHVLPRLAEAFPDAGNMLDALQYVPQAGMIAGWRRGPLMAAEDAGELRGATRITPEAVQGAVWDAVDLNTGSPKPWLRKLAGSIVAKGKAGSAELEDLTQSAITGAASAKPEHILSAVEYLQAHGKEATPASVAELLMQRHMIREALGEAEYLKHVSSIDAKASAPGTEVGSADVAANLATKSATLAEPVASVADVAKSDRRISKELEYQLSLLPPMQAAVLRKKLDANEGVYSKIGEQLGISRARANTIATEAKKELRFRASLDAAGVELRPAELDPSKASFKREITASYGVGGVRRALVEAPLTDIERAAASKFFSPTGSNKAHDIERSLKIPSGTTTSAKAKIAAWLKQNRTPGIVEDR